MSEKQEKPKWWRVYPGYFVLGKTGYGACSYKAWRREMGGDSRSLGEHARASWLLKENGEPYAYCALWNVSMGSLRTADPINGWGTLAGAKTQAEQAWEIPEELR